MASPGAIVEHVASPAKINIKRFAHALLALTKPRIVGLLVVTCLCSMVVAVHGLPPFGLAAVTVSGLALASAGAAAVNMWYDRDIDQVMKRTRDRPLPRGALRSTTALVFGVGLGLVGVMDLLIYVGVQAAAITATGFLYYAIFYTMILKLRTPQAVVIGGLAGALPCVVGWVAVTGHIGITAWLMAIIIFLWTPSHFWPLAIYREADYREAGLLMLPSVKGEVAAKQAIVRYAWLTCFVAPWLAAFGHVGWLYVVCSVLAGVVFVGSTLRLRQESLPSMRIAKQTFRMSLMYVSVVFVSMAVSALM